MSTDTPTPDSEPVLDLDEWIATGTTARRSVEIYNDPALVAEYDELERQLRVAQAVAKEGAVEASVTDVDEVSRLMAAMEDLYERWEASKATWVVRAITDDELDAIASEHPYPPLPKVLGEDKSPEAVAARETVAKAWKAERDLVEYDRNIAYIATGVVEVRTTRGTARGVTREQVRRLRERPHGNQQATRLLVAIETATKGEVEVPRPTWPGRSETARG